MRGRAITHARRLAPLLLALLLLTPAEARTQTAGPSPSQIKSILSRPRMPPILVIIEYGRISIEADVASLDTVLQEVGWPQSFVRTGAPLRIMFSGSAARRAVQRQLKDVNYVVVESRGGRGEIQYYPNDRDGQLANFTPPGREPGRSPGFQGRQQGPFRSSRGTDPTVVKALREQLHVASTPTEKARALDELALYAEEDVVRETALELLGREQNAEVLESALEALDDVRSVPIRPLLDFITRERRKDLRVQAIEMVGRYAGTDAAARELLSRISNGREDESVKRAARSALEDLSP